MYQQEKLKNAKDYTDELNTATEMWEKSGYAFEITVNSND